METTQSNLPERMTTREVADFHRVTTRTIQNWRDKYGLRYIRINSRVIRYPRDAVIAWRQPHSQVNGT